MKIRDQVVMILATGFYTGKAPVAPGTFGSLPGLLLCWAISGISVAVTLIVVFGLIGMAVWVADQAERLLDSKDPGCIVIDEIAGMLVTLVGIPFAWHTALSGFVVFRVLDITKPFPIRALERRLKGGVGVVADDVAAGLIGNLVLRMGYAVIGNGFI